MTYIEQIPRGSFETMLPSADPRQRCVTSARGTIWFCTCGSRVVMAPSKSSGWESMFEDCVEEHEWQSHGIA